MVSVKELSLALFNEEKGSYIRNLVADLSKALKEINSEDVFIKHFNSYGIKISAISCDYYDYLNNIPYAIKAYNGVYMQQYSWEKLATF
jgi:two-component SAPR family response regulator